jgi:hypothetical protein
VKLASLWSENAGDFGLLNRLSSAGNIELLVGVLQVRFSVGGEMVCHQFSILALAATIAFSAHTANHVVLF